MFIHRTGTLGFICVTCRRVLLILSGRLCWPPLTQFCKRLLKISLMSWSDSSLLFANRPSSRASLTRWLTVCALALPGCASHCARGGCVYVNFVLGTYCIVVSGPCQLHLLPYRVAGSVRLVHELFFLFLFFASSCFFMCWRWSFGRSRVCLEDVHMPGVCSVLIRRFM